MSEARFVGPVDRILYLRTLPTLQGLSMRELARFAGHARERFYRKGQRLHEAGRPIRQFFLLVSGRVAVHLDDKRLVNCLPGDNVGLVPALARAGERITAVAEEDALVLAFDLDVMFEIYEENFTILQKALRNLARYQMALLQRTVDGSTRAPWVGSPFKVPARELDVVEKLVLLRRGNIFKNIGLEALVLMATSMVQERWPVGSKLWEPGERADHLFVILDGEVECRIDGSPATFTAGPGYPLGNIETLAQSKRWYLPVIRRDLVTLRGNHEALFDVLEDDFDVAMEFMAEMARGTMASIERMADRGAEASPRAMAFRMEE